MNEVRIHFEGDRRLRRGFHNFLGELVQAARQQALRLELIAGEGHAVRDFMKSLRTHAGSFNALLLDCEGPVQDCSLGRLRKRSDWSPPAGVVVSREQVFHMVQVMESWFLADKETLASYYGKGFSARRLPSNPNVEQITKARVLQGLKASTAKSQKGPYHKTAHGPQLLSTLDPMKVQAACPNCRRLFDELRKKLRRQ